MRRRLIASGGPFKANPTQVATVPALRNRLCPQPGNQITAPPINAMTASCASPRPVAQFPDGPNEASRQVRRLVGLTASGRDFAPKVSGRSCSAAALEQFERATVLSAGSSLSFEQSAGHAYQGLHRLSYSPAVPNPSLKRSANGRPPGPVYGALHSPQPGPGVLPSSPA